LQRARILVGVLNYLYALDAATGKPILEFGEKGRIDLRENLGREPASANSIYLTSPGLVFEDMVIVGGRNPETLPAPPGNIRAFDVLTGKLRWSFRTIPQQGELGYDTWPKDACKSSGSANNCAGMSLDAKRGIFFVPTGSAAFDFYGADRIGDNLFSDCLLALDARTGKRLWHFQGVHHDIWDRDFPSPPVLLAVQHDGKSVDAVAQTSSRVLSISSTVLPERRCFRYRPAPIRQPCSRRSRRSRTVSARYARSLCSSTAHGRSAQQAHAGHP
jgi:quinoprotein glucose dehydrogenase